MMEILVLNLGSSSIKFKLFDMQENKPLASGLAEKIGEEIGQLKIKSHLHHNDQELKEKLVIKDHASGLLMIRENLTKMGIIKDFNQIDAIGHRVVQGGDKFHAPVLVNEKVMQEIGNLSILAPLHNPANLAGIEFVQKAHPHIPQIAVFDTAFHSMGLTPLEGLIMGTRCGDIDPTVVEYIAQCANKSLEEVMKILNHESGLKGICGDNEKHRSQKRKRR